VRGKLTGLVVLAASLTVLVGAPAVGGATSSSTVYLLSGTATNTPGGGCLDCLAFSSVATGSAGCSICQPGDPVSGTFTLSLPTITTYHPDTCRIKTMSGTLRIDWDDGTSSTASVAGHFIENKQTLQLTVKFDDSNFTTWAQEQAGITIPKSYPVSRCLQTTNRVSAALVISG
jgi:hypothetical protein